MHELRTAWLARDQAEKETKRLLGTINNTPDSSDAGTLLNDDGPSLYPLHDVHNVPIARARRSTILIPPTLLTCRSSPPNYGAGNGDIALTRLRQAMNICLDASTRALETERALRTDLEHELSLYRSKIINIQTRPASLGPDFSAVRTTAKLCSFNFTKRLRKRKLYNQPNWKSLTVKRYFLVSDRKTEYSPDHGCKGSNTGRPRRGCMKMILATKSSHSSALPCSTPHDCGCIPLRNLVQIPQSSYKGSEQDFLMPSVLRYASSIISHFMHSS